MALSGSVGSYSAFNYTGGMQQVTIPADGIYKLEVYGAQGGSVVANQGTSNEITISGGKGGYSVGYKKLTKGTVLYICVGGAGAGNWRNGATHLVNGGYNGGGASLSSNDYLPMGSGGGATHIATASGTIASLGESNKSKLLIVAGGGGGMGSHPNYTGGTGGGTNGGKGATSEAGAGGTQTAGGAGTYGSQEPWFYGSYGQGGNGIFDVNASESGGGGGLYGGGLGRNTHPAGGGSGYIGGVPSFTYNGTTYAPSMSNGQRSGNGYAKITLAALTKIYNLNVDGSVVQTVYLDGVALEQIKFDGVSVFGNP